MSQSTPLEPEDIQPAMCTVDLRLEILGQVPFFSGLSPSEIEDVNRRFREKGYEAGEPVYFAGERATHLYVVAAGKVKVLRHTLGGQDVLLEILTPGDFFGALPGWEKAVYPDTAQAQTTCCTLAIANAEFQEILRRYPRVALKVLEITAARLSEAQETIRQLSAHSAERRVAATLLKLAEKVGEPHEQGLLIQMPLSRQDVADMTGTTPETASRILSHLRKQGVIRSGRQWIAIADPEALQTLAQDVPVS